MKRLVALLLVMAIFALALPGCGSENDTLVLKFCTLENEEHTQGIVLRVFKDEVEKLSGGKIKVQNYFNASLYTADGGLQALVNGELEMDIISCQQTADFMPSIAMYGTPYFFKDYDHMRKFADSDLGRKLANQVKEQAGYYVIDYFYNGSRELNLKSSDPVTKPEDLKDTVLRMANTSAWVAAGESLGAKVTTLAYSEVYSALQLGTIDAQDNPLPSDMQMKFYEVTKQISMTDHIIDIEMVGINAALWDRLTDEQKEWISTAMKTAVLAADNNSLTQEASLVDFFKSQGLLITYPDKEAFAAYSHQYYLDKGLTSTWDMEMYEAVQNLAD